jgi:hypothetical protein
MLMRMPPFILQSRPRANRASSLLSRSALPSLIPALILSLLLASTARAQAPAPDAPATPPAAAGSSVHTESPQEFFAHLTPEQRQQFEIAVKADKAYKFSDALAAYKLLLKQMPNDSFLATYASNAALNSGDAAFAMATLKPLAQSSPDDWLVASLYTRACAEAGDAACRDAGIAHMLDLHQKGATPPTVQEYIVEHAKAGDNNIVIWASLEPQGKSKSYDFAQVSDSKGNVTLQLTVESSDRDQTLFKQLHFYEFSKGIRGYSVNAYSLGPPFKSGQRTQTKDTYHLFIGEPAYSAVREQFLKLASGKGVPINTSTSLLAAPTKP